jgi:hypothetical protein
MVPTERSMPSRCLRSVGVAWAFIRPTPGLQRLGLQDDPRDLLQESCRRDRSVVADVASSGLTDAFTLPVGHRRMQGSGVL